MVAFNRDLARKTFSSSAANGTGVSRLAQRITGRYHLDPLSADETSGYVKHRMRVAGATAEVFTPSALREPSSSILAATIRRPHVSN